MKRGPYNGQTSVNIQSWLPAGEAHVEIGCLVVKVDLVGSAAAVERLQGKPRSHLGIKCGTQLGQSPAAGCEITNLDESVLVLEGNDGGVGAAATLVVHGR